MSMFSAILQGGPAGALEFVTEAVTTGAKAAIEFSFGNEKAFERCSPITKEDFSDIQRALSEGKIDF